jgi:AcrR family transcriptional regulator
MESRGSIWMRPERNTRGPDPTYSRELFTAAAIKIADAEGIEALSIRRVAKEVGAGAMSLYRYIDSKDELLELMSDAVMGEEPVPDEPSGDWRADLRTLAERGRALMHRHPWLAGIRNLRRTFGPNTLRAFEYNLRCLDGRGLTIDQLLSIVLTVNGFVQMFVQGELAEQEEQRRTGVTEEQWRATQGPYIQKIIDSGEYPLFTKVIIDAALPHMEPDHQFRTGLEDLLDGIAVKLERSR